MAELEKHTYGESTEERERIDRVNREAEKINEERENLNREDRFNNGYHWPDLD